MLAGIDTTNEWSPIILRPSRDSDRRMLKKIRSGRSGIICVDTIHAQLGDLVETRNPSKKLTDEEIDRLVEEHLAGRSIDEHGAWVFYPWSARLVRVLPPEEFRELRSNRNLYKITAEERDRLGRCTVAVAGLSVGKATAHVMALEGIGGEFRLADPDSLELSNMNRLSAGVHEIGINKAVTAARHILEINPYVRITVFPEGVTDENMDRFLSGTDILIEECDDLYIKVRIRERCRELRIPVLMETSDRGLIDIERFDRETDLPLFHGLTGELTAEELKGLSSKEKVPYAVRIMGEESLSPRAAASLVEIEQTISTWPQLASGVALGSAVSADAARRILLGELNESGRYYVDLDAIVCDGRSVPLPETRPMSPESSPQALGPASTTAVAVTRKALTKEDIRHLVEHGVYAPSAGNCQPWRLTCADGNLDCFLDVERSSSVLDFHSLASILAIGAMVENVSIAAAAIGYEANVTPFPEDGNGDLACRISLSRGGGPSGRSDLLEQIALRTTNRKKYHHTPLRNGDASALQAEAESFGTVLTILERDDEMEEMGAILGEMDRFQLMCRPTHEAMFGELRWTPAEVERTRDGLDIATMDLSPADMAALRVLSSWPAMRALGTIGGGRALEKMARDAVRSSSAMALLSIEGTSPASYLHGGRSVQRLWLAATARGLAIHPWTGICYVFARLERGGTDIFSDRQVEILERLHDRYLALLDVPDGSAEILLFRIGYADRPRARSLRRRIEDVLTFE